MEMSDMVSVRDVCKVLQRAEMVLKISEFLEIGVSPPQPGCGEVRQQNITWKKNTK